MIRTIVFAFCVLVLFSIVTEIKSQNVNRTKRSCHKPPKCVAKKFAEGQCQCGISKVRKQGEDSGGRITKGHAVRPLYKYPWMVGLHGKSTQVCGAALISQNSVLTAAHCISNGQHLKRVGGDQCVEKGVKKPCFKEAKDMKIGYIGRSNSMKHFVRIRKIIPHPKYDFSNYNYDLALLQLETPIKCNAYVRPICLPDNVAIPKPGSIVTISGWGRTEHGKASKILLETQSVLIKPDECKKKGFGKGTVTHICTKGHPGGICKGDSGGPLKFSVGGKFYVFGVVSHSSNHECNPKLPQFFSNVKQSVQWIKQNMG